MNVVFSALKNSNLTFCYNIVKNMNKLNISSNRLICATTAAVGIGTVTILLLYVWWYRKFKKIDGAPSKWRKVGELSDLVMYPIKSLGPVRVNALECTPLGLRSGWLRDRILMVVDLEGQFVTGRQYPKMVQVSPSISGSVLTLQAPGMMSVSINLERLHNNKKRYFRAVVWGQDVAACDCGEEIARWLSRFLLQENEGLRLVYYPLNRSSRDVREKNKIFPLADSIDTGAYSDTTSYTLSNEASITDLNSRLEKTLTSQNFRMNFVVKGVEAYEEDNWDWVKVGQVIFRNVKPCTRCIFTTVDPEKGTKDPKTEPLKTLKEYRQILPPEISRVNGNNPVMGIHLGLRGPNGVVRLGDPVYVGVSEKDECPVTSPL